MDSTSLTAIQISFMVFIVLSLIVTSIGLSMVWNYRMTSAIMQRQPFVEALYLISFFLMVSGWALSEFLFVRKWVSPKTLETMLMFATNAKWLESLLYIYRVWRLVYKYALQKSFYCLHSQSCRETQRNLSFVEKMWERMKITSHNIQNCQIQDGYQRLENFPETKKYFGSLKNNFWIRFRGTLGSAKFMAAIIFIVWVALGIFFYFISFGPSRMDNHATIMMYTTIIVNAIWMLGGLLLIVFDVHDVFRIKIELGSMVIPTAASIFFSYFFTKAGIVPNEKNAYTFGYLAAVACNFVNICLINFNVWRACVGYKSFTKERRVSEDSTIYDILENKCTFYAFVEHLKREFSLENLNFLVDVVMFRRLAGASRSKVSSKRKVNRECGFELLQIDEYQIIDEDQKTIQRSVKLRWLKSKSWHRKENWDIKRRALFIYQEYCAPGAPQEINIPKSCRHWLVDFFSWSLQEDDMQSHVIDTNILPFVFDETFDKILDLLANDSLRRFKFLAGS